MIFPSTNWRVFVFQESIDMRAGFERLLFYAREKMDAKISCGNVYIFFGKNRKRAKLIFFDGTGLVLVSKRLERGHFMAAQDFEKSELSQNDLRLIFHGSRLQRPRFNEAAVPKIKKEIDLPLGNVMI